MDVFTRERPAQSVDVTSTSLVVPSSRDGVDDDAVALWLLVRGTAVPHVDPFLHIIRELAAYQRVMVWSGWSPDFAGTLTGSEVVSALEAAFSAIRRDFPDLPDVVMITGSGLSARGVTWGHFSPQAWRDALAAGRRPELFIGGERLATGAVLTMQTLLHEACHALAFVREVKDTSRQHRYHNAKFRDLAESFGLTYEHESPDPTLGYSAVTLTRQGQARWSKEIAALHSAITLTMDDPTAFLAGPGIDLGGLLGGAGGGHGVAVRGKGKGTGGSSYVRATCECTPERVIRVSASTLTGAPITCGQCESEFT